MSIIQAQLITKSFGSALIEEFISGREATVFIAENPHSEEAPLVYPPLEYMFPEGEEFNHYHLKWYAPDEHEASTVTA